jgi:RHS repeat-associated protein
MAKFSESKRSIVSLASMNHHLHLHHLDTSAVPLRLGSKELHPVQGRWIQPDPSGMAAVDPTNPQSWNRYAYVLNNPLSFVDPDGLDCVYLNDSGTGVSSVDSNSNFDECQGTNASGNPNGGFWVDGTYTTGWYSPTSNDVYLQGTDNGFPTDSYTNVVTASSPSGVDTGVFGNSFPLAPSNTDPMAPSARQTLVAIANAAPAVCGGGFFGFLGAQTQGKKGGHGFAGGIVEWDSNTGWSGGGLVEAGKQHVGGVGGIVSRDPQGIAFIPVVEGGVAEAGIVGTTSAVGAYAEAGHGPVGGGVGGYVNVTTNAGCNQVRGH